jgi:menaquinone-dependent protoporphyrinogen oxidase
MGATRGISRRQFLWAAGGTAVTLLVGTGLVVGSGSLTGAPSGAGSAGAISCEGGTSMKKYLVAYSSICGSTAEVAQEVGKQLCALGHSATVQKVSEVRDLAGYDAVVLGSAIRMGKPTAAAISFVTKNQAALQGKELSCFAVHMMAIDDSTESVQKREAYLNGVRTLVKPLHEGYFAGRIDPGTMGFGDRLLTKLIKAETEDRRDWGKIRAWAQAL